MFSTKHQGRLFNPSGLPFSGCRMLFFPVLKRPGPEVNYLTPPTVALSVFLHDLYVDSFAFIYTIFSGNSYFTLKMWVAGSSATSICTYQSARYHDAKRDVVNNTTRGPKLARGSYRTARKSTRKCYLFLS